MNVYYLIAGILSIALGLIHTVLGEHMIFRHYRKDASIVPSQGGPSLRQRHLRIIWATWHLATVFAWVIGATLIHISIQALILEQASLAFFVRAVAIAMILSALLVAGATQGRHPGWIVMSVIGVLLGLGA